MLQQGQRVRSLGRSHGVDDWLIACRVKHLGEASRIIPHPTPVDPVLQVPEPAALDSEGAPRRDACAVPEAQQAKEGSLRPIRYQLLAVQRGAYIVPECHTGHDCKNTGLRPVVSGNRGHVASRKDDPARAGRAAHGTAPQLLVHEQEPVPIGLQTTLRHPRLRRALRAPDALIKRDHQPAGTSHLPIITADDLATVADGHAA
mmetsp:Transcript_26459/g.75507  ORF Transcript_26459/g.75507 Transcript_26459/m.75507 type:complete len:203 (+) Transcript_26459:920-1528(+)